MWHFSFKKWLLTPRGDWLPGLCFIVFCYSLYLHPGSQQKPLTCEDPQTACPVRKTIQISGYNMKCRGKPDTTWTNPRSITFSPLHFMLNRGKRQCGELTHRVWIPGEIGLPEFATLMRLTHRGLRPWWDWLTMVAIPGRLTHQGDFKKLKELCEIFTKIENI